MKEWYFNPEFIGDDNEQKLRDEFSSLKCLLERLKGINQLEYRPVDDVPHDFGLEVFYKSKKIAEIFCAEDDKEKTIPAQYAVYSIVNNFMYSGQDKEQCFEHFYSYVHDTPEFICECGEVYREGEEPAGSLGLLKSYGAQVALEEYQAIEIAKYIDSSDSEKANWISEKFGPDCSKDFTTQEIIELFLYKSHRNDDNYADTFTCPSCGRLALLYSFGEPWKIFAPEE